jgi:hypothetical protein
MLAGMDDDTFDLLDAKLGDVVHTGDPMRSAELVSAAMSAARRVDVMHGDGRLHLREDGAEPWGTECLPQPRNPHFVESKVAGAKDQSVSLIRRVEARLAAKWEMLAAMASKSQEGEVDSSAMVSPEGLSAFVARVLDQLTLSAWLPAGLLTASLAVLLEFRSSKSTNVLHAVGALTADPVRVLVVIIPLLVIATVVTQAFSFEALRTLEGYWRRRGLASTARTIMIRWHASRKNSINKRLLDAYGEALDAAKDRIVPAHFPESVFKAFRASITGEPNQVTLNAEIKRDLRKFSVNWRSYCSPWDLVKIDQLRRDRRLYPDDDRILPTRLGNVMRATEDRLENAEGDVQGFVLRHYAAAPRLVQLQHDQFRNRLDMYCTMVFVTASLVLLTPAILLRSGTGSLAVPIISGIFAILSVASYHAAVASAGGYCAALKEMDKGSDNPGES